MHWLDQRGTVPLIQQLNAQTDEWRAAELARARKLLASSAEIDLELAGAKFGGDHRDVDALGLGGLDHVVQYRGETRQALDV